MRSDFLVVGAGTAGCLLANRLSKRGSVLLLEAGSSDSSWRTRVPIGYLYSIGNPNVDWMYFTEKEDGLNGRALRYPRGKVLGGCSSINGMIYMRGQSKDYEQWAKQLNDASFEWRNVLRLFKKHENYWDRSASSDLHGFEGEWRVEKARVSWKLLDAFADAAAEAGIPKTTDFNRGNNRGVSFFEVNQRSGWRLNTSRAFLPGANAQNLTVLPKAQVVRLLFEGNKCVGVELADGTKRYAGTVILSAGSLGSVALLELSGIGNAQILEKAGVKCWHELREVGENLQDHLQLRCVFQVNGVETLNTLSRSWIAKARMALEYAISQSGPLSMAPSQLGVFESTRGEEFPNVQFHVQPLSLPAFGEPLHDFDAVTASVCNLNPSSRGSVHIRSSNPLDAPVVRPNYLSTEDDKVVAADSIRLARKICSMPSLQRFGAKEWLPGTQFQSTEDLSKAAGNIGTTIFHPTCTLRMGSVVDTKFRVMGVDNLRVCDASVFPAITSGNTNSPTLMLAEKLSEEFD